MKWENILKRRKKIPNKRTRDTVDAYMETVEGKTTIRDVTQHLMKKLGVFGMQDKPKNLKNYLFGWYSEKMEEFDPNIMQVADYYYDLGE